MERDAKYDNLKLFLIYLVILGHLGNHYATRDQVIAVTQLWVYLFHMPAFVFIAGLFSKNTIDGARWNKVLPYLFLYLFMEIIPIIIGLLFGGIESVSVDIVHETGVAWFALGMLEWNAAAVLFRRVHPAYVLVISFVLSIAAGYLPQIGSFLSLERGIVFFPIFYMGYLTDFQRLADFTKKPAVRITGAILLVLAVIVCINYFDVLSPWRLLFQAKTDFSEIETPFSIRWGWTWRIAFYLISMLLTLAIVSVMPSKKFFFSSLGAKTLPVYVFHKYLIMGFQAIPGTKRFMRYDYVGAKCYVLGLVILLIAVLPIFEIPMKYLMQIPGRKDSAK